MGLTSSHTPSDPTTSFANRGHITRTRILTFSVSVLALAHLGLAATGAEARVFVQDAQPDAQAAPGADAAPAAAGAAAPDKSSAAPVAEPEADALKGTVPAAGGNS